MSCPACLVTSGGMCALCQCGLQPVSGLNPKLIIELASMLDRGSRDIGRRPGETILGQAVRLVRAQLETKFDFGDDDEALSKAESHALELARERGLVCAGEDGITSEMLDELYERGLLQAVSIVDGHVMSCAPKDEQPPTQRQGSRHVQEGIR